MIFDLKMLFSKVFLPILLRLLEKKKPHTRLRKNAGYSYEESYANFVVILNKLTTLLS